MPKIKVTLNKTNTAKLNKLYRYLKENWSGYDEEFNDIFTQYIKDEIRSLRDCSEKNIVEYYIEETKNLLLDYDEWNDDAKQLITKTVRNRLAIKYTNKHTFGNAIDIYFNEVKREYINHPMNESDSLEFCEENKEIFIKNNLKLVIECAKRYRNLGLSFEDLIQIGNLGLMTAFDHFDTNRNKLQQVIITSIQESDNVAFTLEEAESILKKAFTYGKNLDKTLKLLPKNGFISKNSFIDWTKKNVKKAVFASIAFHWIRAYILVELSKYANIIRIPKLNKEGESNSTSILRLDSINPHTDDCYHDNQIAEIANEEFVIEDSYIENMEKKQIMTNIINKALYKLNATDARIIKKRFGIGFPYQLTVNEIAENEGLSTSKVKYIISETMKAISNNISDSDKKTIYEIIQ
ncbi:MAG: hypothetical protein J6D03_00625 [Clostridia bacterium]|nr:hypothetical protein [Clostridia bacterium]